MINKLDTMLPILARNPSAPFDLAEMALLLARDEFPFLDVEGHLHELRAMAYEVKPLLRGHLAHQVQSLCRYLFHEMGFRGNQQDYYDPNNSYFNQVLDRRTGIPITLSAVMMAIGERAGLCFAGVALPGHFIVKAVRDQEQILIDPYHGGRILSADDCEAVVQRVTGIAFEASPVTLAAAPLGLIVSRMLTNLKTIYLRNQDWQRAIRIMERLRSLQPEDVVLCRDLGVALVRNRQPGKAINHLRHYLDAVPEADDGNNIRVMLKQAVKTVAQWN
jgi:regulator of sirC expression with transglutaminase-like and TPR domain